MYSVSISTNNLSIGYPDKVVQTDLNFSLRAGEMVCMLGPNGCGKSTLLRTLAGLQTAIAGTFSLTSTPYTLHHTPRSEHIALVLTERLSLDNTTVHDVVAMGRYPYTSFLGGLSEEDERIIADSLEAVGIHASTPYTLYPTPRYEAPFNSHSDGEKQRILIAKAIAQQTPIILLDEPTAHLDLPNRIKILQLLRRLAHEQGKTILISTHELDLAVQLSDRILLMSEQGVLLDTAKNLREQNAFTEAFGMDIFNPLG